MRLPRNNPKKARIEIVPMIDTIFFLLVFFMLSSLSMISRYSVPVNLPTATGKADQVPQVITVTITKEGNLFYNKEKINSSREIIRRLVIVRQKHVVVTVVINADQNVKHGRVVEVLDAIQQSGLAKIAIAVKRPFD